MKPEDVELPEWLTLYERAGDIKDVNTLLVNRAELREAIEKAVAAERERCALVCESEVKERADNWNQVGWISCAKHLAAAIRSMK